MNGADFHSTLFRLRAAGWRVAVHNDYEINGTDMTQWILRHPSGQCLEGDGRTDQEALARIEEQAGRVLEPPIGNRPARPKKLLCDRCENPFDRRELTVWGGMVRCRECLDTKNRHRRSVEC